MVGVTGKMNGHERLHVAAFLAPRLRAGMHRTAGKFKVVAKDGTVAREITSDELLERLRERAGIELDVAEGKRDLARIAANVKRAEMASAKPGVEQ